MKPIIFSCLIVFTFSCSRPAFKQDPVTEKAPPVFVVRFETTKGIFDVKVTRAWSPLAADRFYQMVKSRYYDNGIFYRVVPDYVAQFGNTDTIITNKWMQYKIPDEPVLHNNAKGTLSYARDGKETRGSELFINLKDNHPRLDTINYNGVKGFPPFGEVVSGMDVVLSLYSGYGNKTLEKYDSMYVNRDQFMKTFPRLDVIKKAYIIAVQTPGIR